MSTPLYDRLHAARFTDPTTSHEAVPNGEKVRLIQTRIYAILTDHGPATHDEIRDWYILRHGQGRGTSPTSIRTRTSELHDVGGVRAVDTNGITDSGRRATRWDIHRDEEGADCG